VYFKAQCISWVFKQCSAQLSVRSNDYSSVPNKSSVVHIIDDTSEL